MVWGEGEGVYISNTFSDSKENRTMRSFLIINQPGIGGVGLGCNHRRLIYYFCLRMEPFKPRKIHLEAGSLVLLVFAPESASSPLNGFFPLIRSNCYGHFAIFPKIKFPTTIVKFFLKLMFARVLPAEWRSSFVAEKYLVFKVLALI